MSDKATFLRLATVFEGGIVMLALLLGWLFSINPLDTLVFNPNDLAFGLLGIVPLYIPFVWIQSDSTGWLSKIKQLTGNLLKHLLVDCRRIELLYVAGLAGFAEEVLFRGFLQIGLEQHFGIFWALLASNLLFALVHWVTPGYALLAGLAGLYLGFSLHWSQQPNLLIPMVIHAGYDYLALLALSKTRFNRV